MTENTLAIVLAAGKGKRLRSEESDLPKVLRPAAGRPLLGWVLGELGFLPKDKTVLVIGYRGDRVREAFPGYLFAEQREQLGTGHAAMSARAHIAALPPGSAVLVCCGDMPLMRRASYEALLREHAREGNDCTLLSGVMENPRGYGRVIRAPDGGFLRIVEERDCTDAERAVTELNSGVYVFRAKALLGALGRLGRGNAQGEYYLTDAPALILEAGGRAGAVCACSGAELLGVNTPEQLAEVERLLSRK